MEQRDLAGQVIDNQIEILEPIGEGGMGAVYRALHRGWNQPMAVKVPHLHLLADHAERERFLIEALTWIELGIHPHIVTCWFTYLWEDVPLLFLDLLQGGNLREEIRQGRLHLGDWGRILALAIQACDGLAHAHQLGLIHRDIKPANLLLDDSGRLCVTDFGLVKNLASSLGPTKSGTQGSVNIQDISLSLTNTGAVVGTPHYASPEQWLQEDNLTPRADLYSLGVVLYEMAVGRVPFDPPSGPQAVASLFVSHTTTAAPDPAKLMPDIPAGLREVIVSCLAKEPAKRPASAREMRNRLSEVYREATGQPYPEVPQAAQQRADSLNNKAVSLWNLNRRPPAMAAWNDALTFDAMHPESVFNRAVGQWSEGKLEPEEVIRRLQTVKATHARMAAYLGLFELSRGQSFEAEIQLKTALQSDESSRDSRLWKALGDCQMLSERYTEAQEAYGRSLELSSQQIDVQARLEMAVEHNAQSELDRQFPRSRPLWETVLSAPARELHIAGERALCLQNQTVTALKISDGSLEWTTQGIETPFLTLSVELNLWTGAPRADASLYRLTDGKAQCTLTEGDKLFAFHAPTRRAVIGNIDLWIAEISSTTGTPPRRVTKMPGHDKQVSTAVFTPSGEHVVTGGYDRQLIVWSTRTGHPLYRMSRHKDYIESVAVSPDGKVAASGSRDRSVRLTSTSSGESFRELKDHPAAVMAVQFTPDGKKLLAWCGSATSISHTLLWDLTDGSLIRRFEGHGWLTHEGQFVLAGRHVSGSHSLEVCRLDTQAWTRAFPADSAVTASDDECGGRYLAVATAQGTVGLWEFSERTRFIATGLHFTRTRGYRDLEAGRKAFQEHLSAAQAALAAKNHRTSWIELEKARALTGYYRDAEALKIAAKLLAILPRQSLRSIWEQRVVRDPSELSIGPTEWLDDGGTAISSAGKWLRVWNAQSGSCIRGMVGHSETVTALDCTPTRALSGTTGKDLRYWDLETGECIKRIASPTLGIAWLKIHSKEGKAVIFTTNQDLLTLDLNAAKFAESIKLNGVSSIAASDDWNYALVGGTPGNSCLSCWNLNGPKKLLDERKFGMALERFWTANPPPEGAGVFGQAMQVTAVCVLASGGFGLTASLDNHIRLWDLQDLRCLEEYRLDASTGPVSCLSWSRDGQHFVSGHAGGSLRVWARNRTKGPIKGVDGHWGKMIGCQLTPDARFVLTILEDRTLRFWELDWALNPEDALKPLRATYPRPGFFSRLLGR